MGKSIIGERRGTGGGVGWQGVNPETMEGLEPVYKSELSPDAAVKLAEEAFESYGQTTGAERARFLRAIVDELEKVKEPLLERMMDEAGLSSERVEGEFVRTCYQLNMFAEVAELGHWAAPSVDLADSARKPTPKPDVRSMMRPIGPVAVFCASNFPLAYSVAGGDTASALAAGCPVVVMGHWAHPGTAEYTGIAMQQAVKKCGLPPGVFSLLFGHGFDLGKQLVQHSGIRAVGFTGSRDGGRALMDLAAARPEPIPVYAEMSAINPSFILWNAGAHRMETILNGFVNSLTQGVGQFCTNPGLLVCLKEQRDLVTEGLKSRLKYAKPGVMLHIGIWKNFMRGVARMDELANVVVSGKEEREGYASPHVFEVEARYFMEISELFDEVFGPSTLVVTCDSVEEMLKVARAMEGQLSASVHAEKRDAEQLQQLLPILERKAGRLIYNGYPTGIEICPSIVHGGPYPATSDGRTSAVGPGAIRRWARRVCWQGFDSEDLPEPLRD